MERQDAYVSKKIVCGVLIPDCDWTATAPTKER